MTQPASTAPAPADTTPVDFDPRLLPGGTLAELLRICEPGSARHRVLLAEQRRRRTGGDGVE